MTLAKSAFSAALGISKMTKRSVRPIFGLVFLVAAAATVCFRIMVSGGGSGGGEVFPAKNARKPSPVFNARLLRFAAVDFAEGDVIEVYPDVMSEMANVLKTIKTSGNVNDTVSKYKTCAVVGNSGILLKHDLGDLIDGHEFVIRLNNAMTGGFERYVGSKTSLSFVNSNVLHICALEEGCFCHPYGEKVPIMMYMCQVIHFRDYVVCNASHKSPLMITDRRFDMLCARIVKYYSVSRYLKETGKPLEAWAGSHDVDSFHYSSGMQAVMLAVGICENVSIFGFGKSESAKHHYHTDQKEEFKLHDYEAEYDLYRDLVERPEAIPFVSDKFKFPRVVIHKFPRVVIHG